MQLNFNSHHKPVTEPCRSRKPRFSCFKHRAGRIAAAAAKALAFAALLITPPAVGFSSARAADLPASIMWVGGVDWYKEAVRGHFASNKTPISEWAIVDEMPLGQMVPLKRKTGGQASPFITRITSTGMAYRMWISHGFHYAGGDSLRYSMVYYFDRKEAALRERAFTWEVAHYGEAPRRDVRWSSSHPSYVRNSTGNSTFPFMSSIGNWTAERLMQFDRNTGRIVDTVWVGSSGGSGLQLTHAMNYGQGNWGGKRRWIGTSSSEHASEGISFFDIVPATKHQLQRPCVFPLPNPDGSKTFLGWVLDSVDWKVSPYDTAAPYDLSARVNSATFVFALLDSEYSYLSHYPLGEGEPDRVTFRPYDVYQLPIPGRLMPSFPGTEGRKGTLASPWYQLANIGPPEIDDGIHALTMAPIELLFFQDSTARFGPWYTRMRGSVVSGLSAEENWEGGGRMTDTGSQFAVDSLVMWRHVKLPGPGDTTFITKGDEYSAEFRVPDTCYGARHPYDPVLMGFLYGRNYYATGSAPRAQGLRALRPAIRQAGSGRYVVDFGSRPPGPIGVFDMQGREILSVPAHGRAAVDIRALPPGSYVIRAHAALRAVSVE